jgi:hypothetical protein
MKKGIIALVFTLITSPFFAQAASINNSTRRCYFTIVNKKMFELMSKVKVMLLDKETQYMNLIKKAGQFESFTTSSTRATNDMKSAAEKYIKRQV